MTTQQVDSEIEEPEGIQSADDNALGEYPLDTMLIRNETRTIYDVLRRIKQDNYIMDPDFQRDFIWAPDKQSKLIESVLMRIPLPVFYIAENDDGRMIVVDGLQRLSTFRNFVDNLLPLRLPDNPELRGKRFNDLSPKLQNRIEDSNLTLYVIDSKAPERARLDIFERVNSGTPLSRQQMRNSLYMGPATRFLKEEAEKQLFLDATGHSLNKDQMRDREFVNRFCAFQLVKRDAYRGEMDDFLADTLKHMNKLDAGELSKLSSELEAGLRNNRLVFERHAFRKHFEGQNRRSVINASLWDVMVTGLSQIPSNMVSGKRDNLWDAFHRLMKDGDFIESITYGTNAVKMVNHRFQAADAMFQKVFGVNSD